jgi:hypothetical protein
MGRRAWSKVSVATAAAVVSLLVVPAAQASFHLIKVREVSSISAPAANDSYVEVQTYSPSQYLLSLGQLLVCDATCTAHTTYSGFPNQSISFPSQATFLIGDAGLTSPTPDSVKDLNLDAIAAGGATCWLTGPGGDPGFNDCASWGNFSGSAALQALVGSEGYETGAPFAAGTGLPGGTDAMSRDISAGCPTLLEPSDDTNDSFADFDAAARAPRSSASTITETGCPIMSVGVNGPGVVTSDGPGINCPGDCSQSYSGGPTVTLTATPALGATFSGWAGDCAGSPGTTCMLNMAATHTAIADFSSPTTAGSGAPTPTTPAPKKCKKHQKLRKGKCVKKKRKRP